MVHSEPPYMIYRRGRVSLPLGGETPPLHKNDLTSVKRRPRAAL